MSRSRGYDDDNHEGYDDEFDIRFADPYGKSSLRAGKRNRPCPTCHRKNMLCAEDVSLGYQCDRCADACEQGRDYDY